MANMMRLDCTPSFSLEDIPFHTLAPVQDDNVDTGHTVPHIPHKEHSYDDVEEGLEDQGMLLRACMDSRWGSGEVDVLRCAVYQEWCLSQL